MQKTLSNVIGEGILRVITPYFIYACAREDQ